MSLILYVEDHPPARLLMQAIIADMTQHQLLLAGSGAEAAALLTDHKPDLYIVDLDLPDTNGIALARALKLTHNAPALLVSAYGEAVQEAPLRDLVYAYLAKPLDPDHVIKTVERALA